MLAIESPYPQFFELDGRPLDAGYVFIGLENQNPETSPITVYWDDALTQPAPQPLRTLNGMLARDGTPAFVYAASDHSMVVKNSRHVQVLYARSSKSFSVSSQLQAFSEPGGSAKIGFLQAGIGSTPRTLQDKVRETFSATDKGAIGDGVADDTAALNVFLSQANRGHIPAGTYRITGPLNFRSNQEITGDGPATRIVYNAVAPAASDPVLNCTGLAHTRISGFAMTVPVTYSTARSILINACTDVEVSDIVFDGGAGGNAAYIAASVSCRVVRLWLDDYRSNGIYVAAGSNCTVEDCDIPNGAGGFMGIQVVGGEGHKVHNNRVALTPDNYFGIHVYGGLSPIVDGNFVKNARREAVAVGGPNCIGARVTNNTLYWDTNLGVGDFGMSITGENALGLTTEFLVEGNTIINSAYDAIGIAGWTQRGRVTNNTIRDCARAGLATHQSGIKLYGWVAGAVCDDITVESNTISKYAGGMLFAVSETPGLGSVANNIIRNNKTFGLTGAMYPTSTALVSMNSNDLELQLHFATPTSSSGALGASATGSLVYQMNGRFAFARLTIAIPANGTGAGAILFNCPFVMSNAALSGGSDVGGKQIKASLTVGGAQLSITNYDNTYPGASGVTLILTGILEKP